MNTERPDNDDDAREAGGAGAADPARDIGGVSDGERGSAHTRGETEAGSTDAGSADAGVGAEVAGSTDSGDDVQAEAGPGFGDSGRRVP